MSSEQQDKAKGYGAIGKGQDVRERLCRRCPLRKNCQTPCAALLRDLKGIETGSDFEVFDKAEVRMLRDPARLKDRGGREHERRVMVREALDKLTASERECVRLATRQIHPDAIGKELGLNAEAVRSQLRRACTELSERLETSIRPVDLWGGVVLASGDLELPPYRVGGQSDGKGRCGSATAKGQAGRNANEILDGKKGERDGSGAANTQNQENFGQASKIFFPAATGERSDTPNLGSKESVKVEASAARDVNLGPASTKRGETSTDSEMRFDSSDGGGQGQNACTGREATAAAHPNGKGPLAPVTYLPLPGGSQFTGRDLLVTRQYVEALPSAERELIRRRFAGEETVQEIADAYGMTWEQVYTWLLAVLKSLHDRHLERPSVQKRRQDTPDP